MYIAFANRFYIVNSEVKNQIQIRNHKPINIKLYVLEREWYNIQCLNILFIICDVNLHANTEQQTVQGVNKRYYQKLEMNNVTLMIIIIHGMINKRRKKRPVEG